MMKKMAVWAEMTGFRKGRFFIPSKLLCLLNEHSSPWKRLGLMNDTNGHFLTAGTGDIHLVDYRD